MALIYNSLEWSLKCNSDDDAVNGGDALRAVNAFVPHGGWGRGGGGECNYLVSDYSQIFFFFEPLIHVINRVREV